MYKNLSIRKRFEVKAPTHPTHDLVAINDEFNKESTVVVGSLWTKVAQDKNGTDYKFLSGTLSKTRTGTDGKEYQGYVLITEREWNEYQVLKGGTKVETTGYTGEVANIDDIGF